MTAKGVLTIAGLILIVQGILFYIFAIPITEKMFYGANDISISIGTVFPEIMAGGLIFIGVILFLSRTNTSSSARRILFGACFGFTLMFIIQLKIEITGQANVPIGVFFVVAIFSVISFVVATKTD